MQEVEQLLRRKKLRIAGYITIFTTQKMGKKDQQVEYILLQRSPNVLPINLNCWKSNDAHRQYSLNRTYAFQYFKWGIGMYIHQCIRIIATRLVQQIQDIETGVTQSG